MSLFLLYALGWIPRGRGAVIFLGFEGEVSKRIFAWLVGAVLNEEASSLLRAQAEIATCQLISCRCLFGLLDDKTSCTVADNQSHQI